MKKILFLMLLVASMTSKAQVYFKNNYDKPVYVAVAYYMSTSDYKGWVSSGWYKAEPGDKVQLIGYLPNSYIYYYAETTDNTKTFDGETSFLVHPTDAFTIKNADMDYVKTNDPAYEWKSFRKYDPGNTAFKLYTTIDFSY